jgi:DDE_Tnp_1-associated
MKTLCEKPRLRCLLDHSSAVTDPREQWRLAHPLPEVLLLVVCGTIGSCDDYDDIVDWSEAHLAFLRRFLPYFHGIPCADWLRTLMNRVDPPRGSGGVLDLLHELGARDLAGRAPADRHRRQDCTAQP